MIEWRFKKDYPIPECPEYVNNTGCIIHFLEREP